MTLDARTGYTSEADPRAAAADLARQIAQPGAACVLAFCSSAYELDALGPALDAAFPGVPVVGATSAGQLGPGGLRSGGISAVSLRSPSLSVRVHRIDELTGDVDTAARAVGRRVRDERRPDWKAFGLLLVDGCSRAEERLIASLYASVGEVPVIGGSAGDDDLAFDATYVLADGRFRRGAVFVLFETRLPFRAFKLQHFEPTNRRCVITAASPHRRVVHEIDGRPAAEAYAALVGVPESALESSVFAANPLMMQFGRDWFVRSVARRTAEGLELFCAIEEGIVLTVGRGENLVQSLDRELGAITAQLPGSPFVLGCDCILRRLEVIDRGDEVRAAEVLTRHRVFGFSTYGEQFNAVHVNQTFTGVALGGER